MPMSGDRVRRMKLQHQAEGYLELGMAQQRTDVLGRLSNGDQADTRTLYLRRRGPAPWNDVPRPWSR